MEKMLEKLQEADMVLVGIGEEFEVDWSKMRENLKYRTFLEQIDGQPEFQWMLPYVEKIYLKEYGDERIEAAYRKLGELLENKNYYIVSTCMDDKIYSTTLKQDRVVAPCGGYHKFQCADNCEGRVWEADTTTEDEIRDCLENNKSLNQVKKNICSVCGSDIIFNNIKADKYAEEGYSEQWNNYMKWLQGTINRKLCVLEMGVGMHFPTVIRWPFEKVVYFNQKASLFRVHSKLYQLTEEIGDRGYSIKEKPIDFLLNKFV